MNRKPETITNPSIYITQIREGSVIAGNIKSEHSIRVDGFVTGDLTSSVKIIIGKHGEIGGNLIGSDITIEGLVNGDVAANGNLHLTASAKIQGKLFAKQLAVENGAEINGEIAIGEAIELPALDKANTPKAAKEVSREKQKVSGEKDSYGTVAW